MKITEIEITPVQPSAGLVAFASCVIDGQLYIGSIGVHKRLHGGYRVVFPARKVGDRRMDYFHPINRIAGQAIEDAIAAECTKLFNRKNDDHYSATSS